MALSATNVNLRGSFGPARPLQYRHAAKNAKASLAKPHQEFISKRVVLARPGLTQFRTREAGIAKAAASDGDQPGAPKKDVETSADDISKAGPEKEAVKAEKSTGEQGKKGRLARLWDGIVDTATTSLFLLKESWSVLMKGFLAFFIIHELCALFQFFIQRLSHRMLNEAAVQFLSLPDGAMQSLWYAIDRPEIMNFQTGYQQLSYFFFALVIPISALVRAIAAGATMLLFDIVRTRAKAEALESKEAEVVESDNNAEKSADGEKQEKKKVGWFGKLRAAIGTMWSLRVPIGAIWVQLWIVELLVTVRVLPLEALSYIVITLPFTMPRILNLQLALPAAFKEQLKGHEALKRSAELAKGIRWSLLTLLLGTLTAARVLENGQALALSQMTMRIYTEIPELPLIVTIVAYIGNRLINRIRDVLPLIAYEMKVKMEEKTADKEEASPDAATGGNDEPDQAPATSTAAA